jgi:hypothetical protein
MAYIQKRSEITKTPNMSVETIQDERYDEDDMIVTRSMLWSVVIGAIFWTAVLAYFFA